jgi:hypothetical protein
VLLVLACVNVSNLLLARRPLAAARSGAPDIARCEPGPRSPPLELMDEATAGALPIDTEFRN